MSLKLAVMITWVGLAAGLCAQDLPAQLPTTTATATQIRISELIALIEGQNTPEVRRTIAKELLRQGWPEGTQRLGALLGGANAPAKIAVASALLEVPEALDPVYIEPLMGMLSDSDAGVRQAAAAALAAYPDNGVTGRLCTLAANGSESRTVRLSAISALGLMTEREAVECLAAVLDDADNGIRLAAAGAMSQATAIDFGDDPNAARTWWQSCAALPPEDWQQRQIERLVRKDRETRRLLEATEARLARALEAGFLRASDTERGALLAQYLGETSVALRLLGMRLVQLHLDQGKTLPAEIRERVRALLVARDPREQAAAVQTVASFRDQQDAERFMAMLDGSTNRDVRVALTNGLGHIGTQTAAATLIGLLGNTDETIATAAVSALGRLAERGMVPAANRAEVAEALLAAFADTTPTKVALRERVLWAMSNVADIRFAEAFTAALDRQEADVVRQAAVRGLVALGNPQYADALAGAAGDPDPAVRKVAVEGLGTLGSGSNEKHVQALWDRVVSPLEAEESIRQAAWRGVLDLLAKSRPEEVERWLARLPNLAPQDHQRAIELLERLAKAAQDADPIDHARLGRIRSRLAAQYALLEQSQDAIAAYIAALDSLATAKSDGVSRTSRDLLRYALLSERYDEQVADAIARVSPQAERPLLWQTVKSEIEPRLTPDGCEQALAILAVVERYPPGAWPHEIAAELQQLRERAQQVKQSAQPSAPTTTAPGATARAS